MWFNLILTLGSIFLVRFCIIVCRIDWLRIQRMNELTNQLSAQYPGRLIVVAGDLISIYVAEDRMWIDSKYMEKYMYARSSLKVNWQKEGF